MQCTKGKCSKAFHVCCARDGNSTGIVFTVLREVEKEVVLVDTAMEASQRDSCTMQVVTAEQAGVVDAPDGVAEALGPIGDSSFKDAGLGSSSTDVSASRVLKVIKKEEVEILCTQHNPVCLFRGH